MINLLLTLKVRIRFSASKIGFGDDDSKNCKTRAKGAATRCISRNFSRGISGEVPNQINFPNAV